MHDKGIMLLVTTAFNRAARAEEPPFHLGLELFGALTGSVQLFSIAGLLGFRAWVRNSSELDPEIEIGSRAGGPVYRVDERFDTKLRQSAAGESRNPRGASGW